MPPAVASRKPRPNGLRGRRGRRLKRSLVRDPAGLKESWRAVLADLEVEVQEIKRRGNETIVSVMYEDIERGLSEEQLKQLKKTGCIIVRGGVPKKEAAGWLEGLKQYIAANHDKVKDAARTHPGLLKTQAYLLSLWHSSIDTPVSVRTPVSYFDRIRIRQPGPSSFVLGPHIDGGSIERWEDPGLRKCFERILEGGDSWRKHDPFDIAPRLSANQDLYNAPNQCTIFRPWQGWTALSRTSPGEGTLASSRSSRPRQPVVPREHAGMTQALLPHLHPHLRLDETVVPIPTVEPGDQVYWHTDVVHAVEGEHRARANRLSFTSPRCPSQRRSDALYIRDQRETFLKGLPAPDFPGGEGESRFVGRGTSEDVTTVEGRRTLGLEPFSYPPAASEGERRMIDLANNTLGF
ncbi:DUF1479-domain-containing protein [Epithele typhae]|uniref:DUF1479-domain-containing protein n=1 Tax=Epithele typhae TaxID=378194 RepID=UPI002007E0C1|nr:DUF1479-domain-containing protein [Epithele typhae]KAH9935185.1 DUF1479-domain-containing protein [Epithele typhae]